MIFNDILSTDSGDFVAVSHSTLFFLDFASLNFVFFGGPLNT